LKQVQSNGEFRFLSEAETLSFPSKRESLEKVGILVVIFQKRLLLLAFVK